MRAILTYHSIDHTGSPISVAPETFRRHVAWLASGAVRVVPLERIAAVSDDEHAVAITFDDGFRNFGELAAPLLADHGLPATVFVVADAVGRDNRWGGRSAPAIPDLALLDWDGLARVAERGITLGAHTRTHPQLPQVDDARLVGELEGSRDAIAARTGTVPATFAYPYGAVDARVADVARRTFALACTTELRPLSGADDPALLPRLDVYYFRAPGALERWGTPRQRCAIAARAVGRRIRRRLSSSIA